MLFPLPRKISHLQPLHEFLFIFQNSDQISPPLNNYHTQQSYSLTLPCFLCNLHILLYLSYYINNLFICPGPSLDCELPKNRDSVIFVSLGPAQERQCTQYLLIFLMPIFKYCPTLPQEDTLDTSS